MKTNTIFFLVKDQKGGFHKLNYADILFVQSVGNYLKFITKAESVTTLGALQALHGILESDARFIQVHRSYIINLEQVEHISAEEVTIYKQKIPIGKTFWEGFKVGFVHPHLLKL